MSLLLAAVAAAPDPSPSLPSCPTSPGSVLSPSSLPCLIPAPSPSPTPSPTVAPAVSHVSSAASWPAMLALLLACAAVLLALVALLSARRPRSAPQSPNPDIQALWGRVRWIEQRLGRQQGVVTADHLAHHQIAEDYRRIVEQQVRDLAARMGPARDARTAARQVAGLCDALFTASGPDEAAFVRLLGRPDPDLRARAARTLEAARTLHARILAAGHRFAWSRTLASAVLNPELQEPWGPCEPGDPVRFVVAPAYVVDDDVYGRQLVYTQP